jgi:MYXO-CTERM domain-containing protein
MAMMGLAATSRAVAADPSVCEPPSVVVVLDRSSSMNGAIPGGPTKWAAARAALDQVLATYDQSIGFGLMTFPYPDACGAGRLDVPPAVGQRGAIGMALTTPPPMFGNWTPLGETLAAAADPAWMAGYVPDAVVVITDGFQWCSPYDPAQRELPTQAVARLRHHGIRTFVVGFGAAVDEQALATMAVLGGTAPAGCDATATDPARRCFHQADDAAALSGALMAIAAHASAETCDGRDNDCDGTVDDGAPCAAGEVCVAGGCAAAPAPAADAGVGADAGEPGDPPGGCGCSGAGPDPVSSAAGLLAIAAVQARRRRRGATSAAATSTASPADGDAAPAQPQPDVSSAGPVPPSGSPGLPPPSGPPGPASTTGAVAEITRSTHAK